MSALRRLVDRPTAANFIAPSTGSGEPVSISADGIQRGCLDAATDPISDATSKAISRRVALLHTDCRLARRG